MKQSFHITILSYRTFSVLLTTVSASLVSLVPPEILLQSKKLQTESCSSVVLFQDHSLSGPDLSFPDFVIESSPLPLNDSNKEPLTIRFFKGSSPFRRIVSLTPLPDTDLTKEPSVVHLSSLPAHFQMTRAFSYTQAIDDLKLNTPGVVPSFLSNSHVITLRTKGVSIPVKTHTALLAPRSSSLPKPSYISFLSPESVVCYEDVSSEFSYIPQPPSPHSVAGTISADEESFSLKNGSYSSEISKESHTLLPPSSPPLYRRYKAIVTKDHAELSYELRDLVGITPRVHVPSVEASGYFELDEEYADVKMRGIAADHTTFYKEYSPIKTPPLSSYVAADKELSSIIPLEQDGLFGQMHHTIAHTSIEAPNTTFEFGSDYSSFACVANLDINCTKEPPYQLLSADSYNLPSASTTSTWLYSHAPEEESLFFSAIHHPLCFVEVDTTAGANSFELTEHDSLFALNGVVEIQKAIDSTLLESLEITVALQEDFKQQQTPFDYETAPFSDLEPVELPRASSRLASIEAPQFSSPLTRLPGGDIEVEGEEKPIEYGEKKSSQLNRKNRLLGYNLSRLPSYDDLDIVSLDEVYDLSLQVAPRMDAEGFIFKATLSPKAVIPPLKQHIVFVFDKRVTTAADHFEAYKSAVVRSLYDLSPSDSFSLFVLDSELRKLNEMPLEPNRMGIREAKKLLSRERISPTKEDTSELYSFLLNERFETPKGSHTKVILLSNGHSLGSIDSKRKSLQYFKNHGSADTTLSCATILKGSNAAMLDLIATLRHGEFSYALTDRGFERKFVKMMRKMKDLVASNVRISSISEHRSVELFPKTSFTSQLYSSKPFIFYGTIDTLSDCTILFQGMRGSEFVQLKKNLNFAKAKRAPAEIYKELAMQRAYEGYCRFLDENDTFYLDFAQNALKRYKMALPFETK